MRQAHAKRRASMKANAGIPWKREWVIENDILEGQTLPVCNLCGKLIEDISGQGLHIDHIISINNGGKDCFTNVACTHMECNLRKEKDDRNLSVEAVEAVKTRRIKFIEEHPEYFEGVE